jgi:hypothetical protein
VLSKAKESVQKIIGSTPSDDSAASDADAAAAADEEEAPLPYEESPPEDGDTDEPDWGSHHDDTNTDPDYEPFDGECIFCRLLCLPLLHLMDAVHGEVHTCCCNVNRQQQQQLQQIRRSLLTGAATTTTPTRIPIMSLLMVGAVV